VRIIVTGGNSGVGRETATALAAAGHSVVIAARDVPKSERAAADMAGDVEVAHLDLADLTSVRKFADAVDTVDVLVNNAGVLGLPLTRTADGFETHMGTNYLGHFALTCLLGDRICDRVVSVTSMNHMFSRLDLDDLNWHTRPYSKWAAYGQSKLALMLFTDELARRGVRAIVVDPGGADTNIARYEDRCTLEHHRGDERPAARHVPGADVQAVRQAEGDQAVEEGVRQGDCGPALEAVGRTDRMRLATLDTGSFVR
jgi:NAD(P)-dependent dehydrogenase (short-subunit alcohol dehydrogenase family)